ncbi:368_t:CDS:2, partial [Dentiscutata erythropus]
QSSHTTGCNKDLTNTMKAPVIGQMFGSWDELDYFISSYTKSQNFVSIIRGSEYKDRICRNRRYVCEYQVRASCPKTTGELKITSVCLNHNDHPIKNDTNKFALKYRTFSEDMLKDIRFWTEIGNINMRTQYQMLTKQYPDAFFLPQDLSNIIQTFKWQNYVECETATLINNLLDCKAKDNRWIVNWKVDSANNSLTLLFWVSPEQYDLYVQYRDVIQHDNTYLTNRFKIALGFFVIVDNNNRSRLIGQAFINDKTTESYEWVLQSLIKNTGVIPLTIITDNDLAINAAIANVLPNTHH